MKTIIASAIATIVIYSITGSASAQALVNPGFETGVLTPWFQDRVFSSGEDWNVTTNSPHSGQYAATNTGNKEIRQNFAPVPTNTIQEISFWARHETLSVSDLFVDLFYSDNTDSGFLVFTQSTIYEQFNVTSYLAPNKQLSGFSIFGNSGGRTFFDDVTIRVVPEPASMTLLLVAGLTLGVWKRCPHTHR
jgi:hypothetical protein